MTGQDGTRPAPLRVGTSGWSYPAGRGTWNGVFYPTPGSPPVVGEPPTGSDFALTAPTPPRASRLASRARAFDELAYYAEHFDTVEVNSTFYRVPTPSVTASWARRTPPDFEFAVKLYQKFTHAGMVGRGQRRTRPGWFRRALPARRATGGPRGGDPAGVSWATRHRTGAEGRRAGAEHQ